MRPWLPLAVFAILWSFPQGTRWLFDAGYRLLELSGGSGPLAAVGGGLFRFWA